MFSGDLVSLTRLTKLGANKGGDHVLLIFVCLVSCIVPSFFPLVYFNKSSESYFVYHIIYSFQVILISSIIFCKTLIQLL